MNDGTARPGTTNRLLLAAVVAIAIGTGLGTGFWIKNRTISLEDINATVLEPPGRIADFDLRAHTGTPFTQDSLKGGWTFMFFGYTHCPDICPTTMATLARMDEIIDGQDAAVDRQVVFVSVDPERDSVEKLAQYVPYFDPTYIGVTGDREDIDRFTRTLGILHVRSGEAGSDGYLVNHSSSILLFNPEGELRALFSAVPHEAADLAEAFLKIVAVSGHG